MTSNAPNAEAAESAIRRIGQEFSRLRGLRGERLEDIANYLDVKATYLFGIEQGDLSVIPSKSDATSILRSYANYLGLDGESIITPMGPIITSLEGKNAPPQPSRRGRLDRTSAAMLTASVIFGVLAGWSWIGDVDQFDLLTPPVTADDLLSEIKSGNVDVGAADIDDLAEQGFTDDAPADEAGAETDAAALSGEAARAADALLDELKSALADGDALTEIPIDEAGTDDGAVGGEKIEDPANVLAALVAERGDGAHIYEAENTDARVIVRALTNVSVQVTSRSRDYVWTRTMKPREMLLVPNRDDLELWTGNAGGVEILLDGTILPLFGPEGTVLSGLSLSAEALENATGALAESGTKPTF